MGVERSVGSGLGWKRILSVFLGVLICYLLAFHGIEYMRHRKGPWVAEFSVNDSGIPVVRVTQAHLSIQSVTLCFPGESAGTTGLSQRVCFDKPGRPVPFGEVIYEDLTFLPGVVTFNLFGHEVEWLPRVLLVDKHQVPWQSGQVIDLDPETKPVRPPQPPRQRRKSESKEFGGFRRRVLGGKLECNSHFWRQIVRRGGGPIRDVCVCPDRVMR